MSLSRLATFIIGLVLAVFGLFLIVGGPFDVMHVVVGLVLIIVGVYLLLGHQPTL